MIHHPRVGCAGRLRVAAALLLGAFICGGAIFARVADGASANPDAGDSVEGETPTALVEIDGTELPPGQSAMLYSMGFVAAKGCLHAMGIGVGEARRWTWGKGLLRATGAVVAVGGVFFMWKACARWLRSDPRGFLADCHGVAGADVPRRSDLRGGERQSDETVWRHDSGRARSNRMTRTEKNPKKAVSQDGPARRISPKAQGGTYCLCASTWFQPSFVANGIHYRVVPTP